LPLVQAFRPHDYGDEHNQTWSAVQDRRGTLYVGNRDVVLTYDGFTWRTLRVGGVNEVGVLEDDGRGGRTFTSLRDRLPPGERDFGNIFQAFAFSHGIYFITADSILWWHDNRFSVEHLGRLFANAIGDELIVHVRGQPLMAWRGAQRRVVVDAPELRRNDHWVTFATARPDGTWILGTSQGGLWRLAGGHLTPLPTGAEVTFRSASIERGLALRDGTIALALRPGGLLVLGPRGEVRHYLDRDNGGLHNAALHGLFQDRAGDLWVLLDQGLARISWPDDVTQFSDLNGLAGGTVHDFLRHRGVLYAGAFAGLFALQDRNDATAPPIEARFRMIPGSQQNIRALASAGDELLVGGVDDVEVLGADGRLAPVIRTENCFSLLVPSHDAAVALAGTERGVTILKRDGWHSAGTVGGLDNDEMRNLVETSDGALWITASWSCWAAGSACRALPAPAAASGSICPWRKRRTPLRRCRRRAVLPDLLEPLGFVIDEAADGAACVARVAAERPDVVLLDLRMPVLNGFEAVARLRALPGSEKLPVVALSASVFEFNQKEALAAGCDDFVSKPIQEDRLLESLRRIFGLDWELANGSPPGEVPTATAEDTELPEPADLAALDELVSAGDLAGLRERIAAALAAGRRGAAFFRQLDELAAGFRTADLRQRLSEAHLDKKALG